MIAGCVVKAEAGRPGVFGVVASVEVPEQTISCLGRCLGQQQQQQQIKPSLATPLFQEALRKCLISWAGRCNSGLGCCGRAALASTRRKLTWINGFVGRGAPPLMQICCFCSTLILQSFAFTLSLHIFAAAFEPFEHLLLHYGVTGRERCNSGCWAGGSVWWDPRGGFGGVLYTGTARAALAQRPWPQGCCGRTGCLALGAQKGLQR